jgi:hypothetical protein
MRPDNKRRICKIHILERGLQLVIILLQVRLLHIFKEAVFTSTQAASNINTINQ